RFFRQTAKCPGYRICSRGRGAIEPLDGVACGRVGVLQRARRHAAHVHRALGGRMGVELERRGRAEQTRRLRVRRQVGDLRGNAVRRVVGDVVVADGRDRVGADVDP
ncbi:MAG: hypothetical protein ACK56I_28155, partial [bacterium]